MATPTKSTSKAPQATDVARPPRSGVVARTQAVWGYGDLYQDGNPESARRPMEARSFYPEITEDGYVEANFAAMLALFEDMLRKDGKIYGALEQRRAAVLSRDRAVLPHSDAPEDRYVAAFVQSVLDGLGGADGGFDADLYSLLDGIQKGLSIAEIEWQATQGIDIRSADAPDASEIQAANDGRTWFLPVRLHQRNPAGFKFDIHGQMHHVERETETRPKPVAPRKYLVLRYGSAYENPYGCGLLARLWWYYRFKRETIERWLVHNAKHGSPTTVGKYPTSASDEEIEALENVIQSLETQLGAAIPDTQELELLSTTSEAGSNGETYQRMLAYCDDAIAQLVLGSTLTSGEGNRVGSMALGQVHKQVADDKIEADAKALMWVINQQLIRWIVDVNFGVNVPAPAFSIDTTPEGQRFQDIELDKALLSVGVPIPLSHFREHYKRPAPREDEPFLSHDDQDVFQYHMQFGVLTINEARYRLGLPPVPWGEAPVNSGQAPTGTPLASEEDPRRGDPREGDPAERAEMAELFRDTPHEYASTQITVPLDHARDIQRFQREIPEEELHEMGIETDIHITARYGLIEPIDAPEANLQQLQQALADTPPLRIACGRLNRFQAPDYDVLYIEVLSPDLHRLHKAIGDATRHHDTHPDYTPHITVAYLQPGEGAKFVGDDRFRWLDFSTRELIYSDTQGRKSIVELRGPEPEGQNMAEDPRHGVAAMTHETNALLRALLADDPPEANNAPRL